MNVEATLLDCTCGGFDVIVVGRGRFAEWLDIERRERAIREFRSAHDGDGCRWGHQPVPIEIPSSALSAARG